MGYSVAITARSLKARNLILSFMNKEYRPWKELDKTYKVQNSFGPTNDLGYNDGLLKVGFNMSACDPEYTYIFTIIKWMALQVGRKQKVTKEVRKCDPNFEWPKLPYLVYDGYETWPIITNDVQNVPTDYKWAQVDEHGWAYPSMWTSQEKIYNETAEKIDKGLIKNVKGLRGLKNSLNKK